MATYKVLHGINVQYRDSDATAIEGDVWYNSSTGKLKMYASVGSWASGGTLNTARQKLCESGCGTQDAGFIAGGATTLANTEQYDGSSWTEIADINTATSNQGAVGISTAALCIAGTATSKVGNQ